MVNKCVALGCNTGYGSSREKVSAFLFPRSKPKLLQKWVNFVNRANWIPTNNSVLCSKHFEDKFVLKGKRNKLDWSLYPIPTVGVHFGKVRRRRASLLPTQAESMKTPQHHNIERKRFQDVFPIDLIKDCCCKTSPCIHSGKLQCNLSKRKTNECLDTPIVPISNDTYQQLTVPLELQTKQLHETNLLQKNRFGEPDTKKRRMLVAQPAQVTAPPLQPSSQKQFQNLQVSATGNRQEFSAEPAQVDVLPAQIDGPPTSRHVQVLSPSGQKSEPKPVQNHQSQVKKVLLIVNHQNLVMSNLSSLWKNRKLCDAGISNGTSTVKVHKVVLSAICPKLLSAISTHLSSQEFLQVNFPQEVSTEALNAFAEYMYNGILDLNSDILKQLKIIANRLEMKEFEQLCDSRLPKDFPQSADAAKLPSTQMVNSVPAMTSSLASYDSPVSINSTPCVTTQVVYINQEITEAELEQVKMETDHIFGQESELVSLTPNKSGNSASVVICPNIKAEPVEPENNKYGHVRSTNPLFTSTTSPYSTSSTAAASTSISSVPSSSKEFSIPFSQSTDFKSTILKSMHSYETPLVSALSSVSCIGEPICSQSSSMNEDISKQLSRQSIPTSSLQLPPTSTDKESIHPVGLYMAGRRLPSPVNNKCKIY